MKYVINGVLSGFDIHLSFAKHPKKPGAQAHINAYTLDKKKTGACFIDITPKEFLLFKNLSDKEVVELIFAWFLEIEERPRSIGFTKIA